jgi:hypothetical protein
MLESDEVSLPDEALTEQDSALRSAQKRRGSFKHKPTHYSFDRPDLNFTLESAEVFLTDKDGTESLEKAIPVSSPQQPSDTAPGEWAQTSYPKEETAEISNDLVLESVHLTELIPHTDSVLDTSEFCPASQEKQMPVKSEQEDSATEHQEENAPNLDPKEETPVEYLSEPIPEYVKDTITDFQKEDMPQSPPREEEASAEDKDFIQTPVQEIPVDEKEEMIIDQQEQPPTEYQPDNIPEDVQEMASGYQEEIPVEKLDSPEHSGRRRVSWAPLDEEIPVEYKQPDEAVEDKQPDEPIEDKQSAKPIKNQADEQIEDKQPHEPIEDKQPDVEDKQPDVEGKQPDEPVEYPQMVGLDEGYEYPDPLQEKSVNEYQPEKAPDTHTVKEEVAVARRTASFDQECIEVVQSDDNADLEVDIDVDPSSTPRVIIASKMHNTEIEEEDSDLKVEETDTSCASMTIASPMHSIEIEIAPLLEDDDEESQPVPDIFKRTPEEAGRKGSELLGGDLWNTDVTHISATESPLYTPQHSTDDEKKFVVTEVLTPQDSLVDDQLRHGPAEEFWPMKTLTRLMVAVE